MVGGHGCPVVLEAGGERHRRRAAGTRRSGETGGGGGGARHPRHVGRGVGAEGSGGEEGEGGAGAGRWAGMGVRWGGGGGAGDWQGVGGRYGGARVPFPRTSRRPHVSTTVPNEASDDERDHDTRHGAVDVQFWTTRWQIGAGFAFPRTQNQGPFGVQTPALEAANRMFPRNAQVIVQRTRKPKILRTRGAFTAHDGARFQPWPCGTPTGANSPPRGTSGVFVWSLRTLGFEPGAMGPGVMCSSHSTDRRP